MVLELARLGTVDGPVGGVVGAGRQLIDDDGTVLALHELNGEDTDDVEAPSNVQGHGLQLHLAVRGHVRCRADGLGADPVTLDGLRDRIGGSLTRWGADDNGREFASEINELLGENTNRLFAVGQSSGSLEGFPGTVRSVDLEDSLAVISAARRLGDDGPAVVRTEGDEIVRGVTDLPGRVRESLLRHEFTHDDLVLSMDHRGRSGADSTPCLFHLLDEDGRHVLVIEGHDVTPSCEVHDGVVVEMGADDDIRHHLGRGLVRVGGQQTGAHPQSDRSLVHHAGKLPAANDSNGVGGHDLHRNGHRTQNRGRAILPDLPPVDFPVRSSSRRLSIRTPAEGYQRSPVERPKR